MSRPGIMDLIGSLWNHLFEVNTHHRTRCVSTPTTSCSLCREESVAYEHANRVSADAIELGLIGPAGRVVVDMYRKKYERRIEAELEEMKEKAR